MEKYLCDPLVGKDFFFTWDIVSANQIRQINCSSLNKNFCSSKDTIKRANRQVDTLVKVSALLRPDRGLVSRVYKKYVSKQNNKNTRNPFLKQMGS